jgi:hypothetical protein
MEQWLTFLLRNRNDPGQNYGRNFVRLKCLTCDKDIAFLKTKRLRLHTAPVKHKTDF